MSKTSLVGLVLLVVVFAGIYLYTHNKVDTVVAPATTTEAPATPDAGSTTTTQP